MPTRLILSIITTLALAACTTGESQPPAASPSPAAVPTPVASVAPSPSPSPLLVKVQFDGATCAYLGPEVFPEGTVVVFQFTTTPDWEDLVALQVIGVTRDVPADVLGKKTYGDTSWMVALHSLLQLGPGDAYFTMTYRDADEIAILAYCRTNITPEVVYPAALLWAVPM